MKLESITLNNFQAHERLEIKFSPTITTIKGATDKGKSAVLRALRWVCLNDTAGVDFIKEGTKRAIVTLTVVHEPAPLVRLEEVIVRSKNVDGATNTYALDGKEFKAFGQGVPPDIAKTLALSEINFQGQHDSPFWFAETSGEVSRRLNAVIDLSIIDTALANIGAEVRRASERKSLGEERLNEAKTQLEELAPQRERIEEFHNVKVKQTTLKAVAEDYDKLADVLERASSNQARVLAAKAADGGELLAAILSARRAQRSAEMLEEIIYSIGKWQSKAKPPPDFHPVQMAWGTWADARAKAERLSTLTGIVFDKLSIIRTLAEEAQQAEAKFHAQVRGKVCPLCKQIIELDER